MSDRGISSPLGVILLLGITITAVMALFLVGGTVLSDTRTDAERSQTENSMAQFSSKASLVGLGESGDQRFSLGRLSEGDVTIDPNAGRVTLFVNETHESDRTELNSTELGAVVYRSGDREIAYQGGGVWERQGEWSQMISPPEYHYRLETLTLPIMTVSGGGRSSGDVRGTVRTGTDPQSWYPIEGNESRSNPLDIGTVIVRIESRYCRGWETFFIERTQGVIEQTCEEGDEDAVEVDLTIPFHVGSERPVRAEAIDPGTGDGDVPGNWEEDVAAPSVSSEVEKHIQDCEAGGCETLPESGTIGPAETGDEMYWSNDSLVLDKVTFETGGEEIIAVVDGGLDLEGDINVTGGGSVTLYVRENVVTSPREINTGGNADELSILVHSDADSVDISGNVQYTGVLYAPGTEIDVNGNTDVKGVIVGETVDLNGKTPEFDVAEELEDYQIVTGNRALTYLHVSENEIEVELD